jgi:hypothetical protein
MKHLPFYTIWHTEYMTPAYDQIGWHRCTKRRRLHYCIAILAALSGHKRLIAYVLDAHIHVARRGGMRGAM